MFDKDIIMYCKRLNKAVKYMHDHKASIYISKLECDSLQVTAYSDAEFAKNDYFSSAF